MMHGFKTWRSQFSIELACSVVSWCLNLHIFKMASISACHKTLNNPLTLVTPTTYYVQQCLCVIEFCKPWHRQNWQEELEILYNTSTKQENIKAQIEIPKTATRLWLFSEVSQPKLMTIYGPYDWSNSQWPNVRLCTF